MPDNPPLTHEQIEFFAEQNRIAAASASKRTARRALVGYLILAFGVLGLWHNSTQVSDNERAAIIDSGSAVIVDSCNRDFRSTQRLRSLLERAQAQIAVQAKAGKITAQQAADAAQFYTAELARIPLPDCRKAVHALTDDPGKPIRTPIPLHAPEAQRPT